jgi:rod shape-determining protein MreD
VKKLIFILLVALAFVIESKVRVLGIIRLNLTVVFVYYIGLRYGPTRGLFFGASLGIVADSLAGGIMGPNLLGKAAAGYLAAFLKGGMFIWTPLLGFIGLLALTFLDGAVSFFSTQIFLDPPTAMSNALIMMFWQGAINSIAGLFIKPRHED